MAGNSIGQIFRLITFGESHGKAIGGIIDGCPAGLELDLDLIQKDLDRRKPGQSNLTTERKESDQVQWLSGIFEGQTLGTPIAFSIPNQDQKSKDYSKLKNVFRPSHADFVFQEKYGIRDHRGGGRSSARETASRVVAGGVAKQLLATAGVQIRAFVTAIGQTEVSLNDDAFGQPENELRCPDESASEIMRQDILNAKEEGDTLGGVITCVVKNCPIGLGEPVFDKLHADLAKAMMSINATRGFEIGSGFDSIRMKGSEHNDTFRNEEGQIKTATNNSGGIQGGISNGMPIEFKVAFKPVASIKSKQETVDVDGIQTSVKIEGRHDPCVVPRAVPIVEAMAAITLADHYLRNRMSRI